MTLTSTANSLLCGEPSPGKHIREKTKTGKKRRVDLSDELLESLITLRRKRKADFLAKGGNQIPEWVFINREGNPLDMDNIRDRVFFKALDKAGLRGLRLHDLRHTFASLHIQKGESLAYVRDQLGHGSIKTTVDIYGHLVPGANREAANRLPGLKVKNWGGPEGLLDGEEKAKSASDLQVNGILT